MTMAHMSYSVNSFKGVICGVIWGLGFRLYLWSKLLKGGYIRDIQRALSGLLRGILGVETIAHMNVSS